MKPLGSMTGSCSFHTSHCGH